MLRVGCFRSLWKLSLICYVTGSALIYSCKPGQSHFANQEFYHLEVIDSIANDSSYALANHLLYYLTQPKQYYLSDNTADLGWPYYGAEDVNKEISSDSLMVPHIRTHILTTDRDIASKSLTVILVDKENSKFFFREEITELDGAEKGRTLVKTPVDHVSIAGSSIEETAEYIAKSAIRSTFK